MIYLVAHERMPTFSDTSVVVIESGPRQVLKS